MKLAVQEGERRLKSRTQKAAQLKRELKQRRKTIETYETLLRQQQSRPAVQVGEKVTSIGGRQYVALDYLQSQIPRRVADAREVEERNRRSRREHDEALEEQRKRWKKARFACCRQYLLTS